MSNTERTNSDSDVAEMRAANVKLRGRLTVAEDALRAICARWRTYDE